MGLISQAIVGHAVVKHAIKSANKPSTIEQINQCAEGVQTLALGIQAQKQKTEIEEKTAPIETIETQGHNDQQVASPKEKTQSATEQYLQEQKMMNEYWSSKS